MDKNRSTKIAMIVALLVAVVGLSIGFAAFSNNLTIKSSATVTPDASKFDVNFSSTDKTETDGEVLATITPTDATITGDKAIIDNSDNPTITGLKANFTEPGQTVTYSFFAHNAGEYIAYLNTVTFANAQGAETTKVCTAKEGTTQALVDTACKDISITVKVGSETFTGSQDTVSNHSLALNAFEPVVVTISYATNTNINIADGDFDVKFGDITLNYGSVD